MSKIRYQSVQALRSAITSKVPLEYRLKMYQPVPDLPTVKDRAGYLMLKAKDKVVLDIGCTGSISAQIRLAAKEYFGVDKEAAGDNCTVVDLDQEPQSLPKHEGVELIICSEVLEHLSNPGRFLAELKAKYPGVPTYFTVPNAGACKVRDGHEIVNGDHVAWYSYSTLRVLLARYDYKITLARWYNGEPVKAEGLIFLAE